MAHKVLIANRGEIAVRIIRTCREMGIGTVAVYSDADADALHVRMADEAVRIGPPPAPKSYLNIPAILEAARTTRADAVHPGYGFLAENEAFAGACRDAGLVFVGPSQEVIGRMGNKAEARRLAREADVPVVPGTLGTVSPAEATQAAEDVGYPILVKAAAGGGGRGIRAVEGATDLDGAIRAAAREARAAFGDDSLYLERQLLRPRHVEVQVIGDTHGNLVHLFDRECSLQRHRQKIIEEAPSPAVSPETRAAMTEAAVRLARATGYTGAGTIEFLLEGEDFYFIEMNTRIQVEHPVTEMITGVDIVEQQFRVALGDYMSFTQDEITMDGCAIELRINAEDPERGFFPSPGVVADIEIPGGPGVRIDSALYPGAAVQPFYDSLVSKLIVWKDTRPGAVARARRAADEYKITGIKTTLPLLRRLIDDEAFVQGKYHVHYLEALLEGAAASGRL